MLQHTGWLRLANASCPRQYYASVEYVSCQRVGYIVAIRPHPLGLPPPNHEQDVTSYACLVREHPTTPAKTHLHKDPLAFVCPYTSRIPSAGPQERSSGPRTGAHFLRQVGWRRPPSQRSGCPAVGSRYKASASMSCIQHQLPAVVPLPNPDHHAILVLALSYASPSGMFLVL